MNKGIIFTKQWLMTFNPEKVKWYLSEVQMIFVRLEILVSWKDIPLSSHSNCKQIGVQSVLKKRNVNFHLLSTLYTGDHFVCIGYFTETQLEVLVG
jgi:hypothetical protein